MRALVRSVVDERVSLRGRLSKGGRDVFTPVTIFSLVSLRAFTASKPLAPGQLSRGVISGICSRSIRSGADLSK